VLSTCLSTIVDHRDNTSGGLMILTSGVAIFVCRYPELVRTDGRRILGCEGFMGVEFDRVTGVA
jgi:hypothetical protein